MRVTVRLYGVLREFVGSEAIVLELDYGQKRFCDVLKLLLDKSPQLSQFIILRDCEEIETKGVSILVNGRHVVFLGGGSALVKDGDTVDILPPLHGG